MLRQIKAPVLVAVTIAVLTMGSATALAYNNQQRYTNDTGQTAHDLTKILLGDWDITSAIHHRFNQHVVVHIGPFTVLHFFDGTVAPGEWTWACFNTASGAHAPVISVFWTDENGNRIGDTGPGCGTGVVATPEGVIATVGHDWSHWIGRGFPLEPGDGPGEPRGPITGVNVFYAVTDRLRPMEELTEELYQDPSIQWRPLPSFQLNHGDRERYNLEQIPPGGVVLMRYMARGEGLISEEMVQFEVPGAAIPTVSEWGLIVMALLLLTAGTIVLFRMRRRRPATA